VTPLRPFRAAAYGKEVARARGIASKCTARNGAKLLPYIHICRRRDLQHSLD
jgi:hypothetical protein